MLEDPQEYLRRSEEAEQKADTATDLEAKRIYWRIADIFRELAQALERRWTGK